MSDEYAELSAYLDGELSPADRLRVEIRLAADPGFARKLHQLERTSTMLAACMERPGFHASFFARLRATLPQTSPRRRPWGVLACAGAAVVAVVIAAYWNGGGPQAPPALVMSEQEPPETGNAPPAFRETPPAQITGIREDTAAPLVDAATDTIPPIELCGTVTGEHATAILRVVDEGGAHSRTYAAGDEILPGVLLVSIEKGHVTLDDHGREVILTPPRVPSVNFAEKLDGTWELVVTEGNGDNPERMWVHIKREGHTLVLDGMGRQEPVTGVEFELTGRHLTVYLPEMDDAVLSGSFTEDGNTIDLTQVLPEDEQNRQPAQARLTRAPDESEESIVARQDTLAECDADLQLMYAVLRQYAELHDGAFPPSIDALAIQDAATMALFEDSAGRNVTYMPGVELPDPMRPADPPVEPIDTYADRLMAYESQLRAAGFAQLCWPDILLRVRYADMSIEGTADAMGRIRVVDETALTASSPAATQRLAGLRARDQNNLKQLGLVIKMFQNEHRDFTPPGWLSVYPEYLTDVSILTSPKDPAGKDSYDYLLPATNIEAILRETLEDPENRAAWAQAMSQIPVVINKTDWPDGGRNILYADGHVEYDRNWRDALTRGVL